MKYSKIDDNDKRLIAEAEKVLEKNYNDPRHTVGAAVLCGSGEIYTGINIESCGYGPCAEPIAIGAALSNGEKVLLSIVAVGKRTKPHTVLFPCGNCRQLLFDYAPDCMVVIRHNRRLVKIKARDLIPDAYCYF